MAEKEKVQDASEMEEVDKHCSCILHVVYVFYNYNYT